VHLRQFEKKVRAFFFCFVFSLVRFWAFLGSRHGEFENAIKTNHEILRLKQKPRRNKVRMYVGCFFYLFSAAPSAWPAREPPWVPAGDGAGFGQTSPVQPLLPALFWLLPAEGMRMKSCLPLGSEQVPSSCVSVSMGTEMADLELAGCHNGFCLFVIW
jgi:hypothetical protein